MKVILTLLFGILHIAVFAQVVATFENFNLAPGEHLNDASPEDGFISGSIFLSNYYDPDFDFWSGFAISADTNTTTPGFLNQYSSIAGEGALGSTAYAVGYVFDPEIIYPIGKAKGKPMIGLYVTNTTYAYLSMRDGDAFAKKFGGETGNDPDFFMLTFKKYSGGAISDDSINYYLADYRSADPAKDYIVSDWRYVDLSSLGEVDSLIVTVRSSDVGIFGMNTPAYICFDEIITDDLLSASDARSLAPSITFGPNPARHHLQLYLPVQGVISIYSLQGMNVWSSQLGSGDHHISLEGIPDGMYMITLDGVVAGKFSIQ